MEKKSARQALAENLRRLMDATPALNTGKKIEAKTAGRVVQRTVSNMKRADQPDTNSPTLDNIEEVAGAFGLEAWQLLIDDESLRQKVYTALAPPPARAPPAPAASPRGRYELTTPGQEPAARPHRKRA